MMNEFPPAGFCMVFEGDDEKQMVQNMIDEERYPLARITDKSNEVFVFCDQLKQNDSDIKDKNLIAIYITYYSRYEYEC